VTPGRPFDRNGLACRRFVASALTQTNVWIGILDQLKLAPVAAPDEPPEAKGFALRELFFFFLVGGSSAALYTILNVGFAKLFGVPPSLAIVLTLVVLMPPTYLAQRRITFQSSAAHAVAFPRYVGTQVIGNILAIIGSAAFPLVILARPWLSFAVIAVGVALTNYLLLKFWTFGTRVMIQPNAQYNVDKPEGLSVKIATAARERMFRSFMDEFTPGPSDRVLDLGVTSDQSFSSSNYFERLYPHKDQIVAAGVDDASFLAEMYPGVTYAYANALDLPFPDHAFDYVHSAAVLEHVGSLANQQQMVEECLRVARKGVFLTTPNRWFPIEFHTVLPLVHWLPKPWGRAIFKAIGYDFFAQESNLNLMTRSELRTIMKSQPHGAYKFLPTRLMGWTSNLVLAIHK
jgi:putative flippase GtrA